MKTSDKAKMTLSELYKTVGGDIDDVLERLEDAEIVESFVLRFEDDPSFYALLRGLKENDLKSAFRAAHTLKGISFNLGFRRLGDFASVLCDELREGILPSEISLRQLKSEYGCVISAIRSLKNNN